MTHRPSESPADGILAIAPEAARLLLQQTLGSQAFRSSARHRAMLAYLVDHALADDLAALKESVLGVEVFDRPASAFDPRNDSIVRVEARRLRARLAAYFGGEGRAARWRIDLPVGSYVPVFVAQGPLPDAARQAISRTVRDLVERGQHFLNQPLSQATLISARDRFEAALRRAPDHAPACVGLARAWLNLASGWYVDPREATEHAAEALRHARTLAPDDALTHTVLAVVQHQFERDWPSARRGFVRALQLAPHQAFAHSAFGAHLVMRGLPDEAERVLQRARQLDPLYINARMHMVNLRILQGRLGQAQAELEAMADLAETSMPVAGLRGLLSLLNGCPADAVAHYRRAVALAPGHPGAVASLAAALGAQGDVGEADRLIASLHDPASPDGPPPLVSPYVLAIVATRCGRHDQAMVLLHRSVDARDPSAIGIPVDPSFHDLHGQPTWPALVAMVRRKA